jgi:hypothetical protein
VQQDAKTHQGKSGTVGRNDTGHHPYYRGAVGAPCLYTTSPSQVRPTSDLLFGLTWLDCY